MASVLDNIEQLGLLGVERERNPILTQPSLGISATEQIGSIAPEEERPSKFRDFVLQAGGGRSSLLNTLSAAFGQGTEEIAARKRNQRIEQLEEAETEARLKALQAPAKREVLKDASGRNRFTDTGEFVFSNVDTSQPTTDTGRDFQRKLDSLPPDDAELALRINLGLEPRAITAAAKPVDIGGVPHIFNPDTRTFEQGAVLGEAVTAETVGASEGTIAGAVDIQKGRAQLTTKAIDSGFDKINSVRGSIRNIDRAIRALDEGANTGAIARFFPNIRASSVKLAQAQNDMGLDVIGAVTFGALSKGELDLALRTAVPTGLDEGELRTWLVDKKTSQDKLINYFSEQINFLDGGGTVNQWVQQQSGGEDVPTVTSQAEFDALPSGAEYTEDGQKFRKP